MYYEKDLTEKLIAAAIEVHRNLGPGLLESMYEECLCQELKLRSIPFERQKPVPLVYKGTTLNYNYRIDVVVDKKVILELKCVDQITLIHQAQLLTYLKLTRLKLGMILNFTFR